MLLDCLVRCVVPLQSPVGYLRSGVTATLADQLGSAVFFCSGLPSSGVSIEISVSFVDAAAVGVRLRPTLSRFTFPVVFDYGIKKNSSWGSGFMMELDRFCTYAASLLVLELVHWAILLS